MSDEKVDTSRDAKMTSKDVMEMAAHLMFNMPEPDADGVLDDDELELWESELKHVCTSISDKVHVMTCVADRLAAEAAFIRGQEQGLAKLRKVALNKRDRVVARARHWLETVEGMTGDAKVKTSAGTVKLQRSKREVVRVADGATLPDSMCRIKRDPDLKALMQLYKDTGAELLPDGVTVEESHSEAVMWSGKVK